MPDPNPTLTAFTAGDLVISIYGDGAGTGSYTLDQAAPIVLEELTTTGTIVGDMILPQTTTVVNGVTQYGISGEYGSASEGSLQLSGDGQSLVIMGYGVNWQTFDGANAAAIYGTTAEGQTTSVPGGAYTAVPRIVADIGYNGTVNTSTALYNVDNSNNPRSVATINGTTFYISGQGVSGDTTQGVFVANEGASGATAIDTSTDTRTAVIYNGELYVSRDSTQGVGGTISNYGSVLPTGTTTATVLGGIDGSITLTAGQANGINTGSVGQKINLSPENFFFASSTVLYVADSGVPKEGGIGDGGLQKWIYNSSTSTWVLAYTLTSGLNLVANTASLGTTGLIGLTGTVVGGVVELYTTNYTVTELGQSYLFGITDTLAATLAAHQREFRHAGNGGGRHDHPRDFVRAIRFQHGADKRHHSQRRDTDRRPGDERQLPGHSERRHRDQRDDFCRWHGAGGDRRHRLRLLHPAGRDGDRLRGRHRRCGRRAADHWLVNRIH